jgi:hypothetical protein
MWIYERMFVLLAHTELLKGYCTTEPAPSISDQSWGSVRTLYHKRRGRRRHQKHFITTWQSGSANTPVQFSVGRPASDSDTVLSLRGCQATERSAASCFDRLCGIQFRGREMGRHERGKSLKQGQEWVSSKAKRNVVHCVQFLPFIQDVLFLNVGSNSDYREGGPVVLLSTSRPNRA